MMALIWLIICAVSVLAGFVPNKLINTNCKYVYIGNLIVIVGALVGLSGRPVIATSIVALGVIVVIWGAMCKHNDC